MRRIIILVSISLISQLSLCAQNLDEALVLDELNYFQSTSDSLRTKYALQKMQRLLQIEPVDHKAAYKESQRIFPHFLSQAQKFDFYWNTALLALIIQEPSAIVYAKRYAEETFDKSMEAQILYFMTAVENSENGNTSRYVEDSVLKGLFQCLEDAKTFHSDKIHYNIASAIVPGSGMMLKGHYEKGLSAFGLNALGAIGTYALFKNGMYGNALGLGALFFSRLYTGNIRFTNKLLPKKQHKTQSEKLNTCEDTFQTYLSMYPLVFR